jgi:hypothetical protein
MSPATCLWWLKNWGFVLFCAVTTPLFLFVLFKEFAKSVGEHGIILTVWSWTKGLVTMAAWIIGGTVAIFLLLVLYGIISTHYVALAERICGCKW